ncbi:MAG TPA: hypothetical protein VK864_11675 [Longimicrobiales bacterium]|nr:hypothetical protein [Longimicrobiales bacterium]
MHYRSMFLVVAIGGLMVAGCAPHYTVREQQPPCSDPLYIQLKVQPPDSLSEREWIRLQELEHACVSARAASEPDRDPYQRTAVHGTRWMIGLGVLGVAAMWLLMAWH